eukprot:TRINITY_DN2364_c0_g1_i2.p1 TRINITY_DN2364_c0_g1~~TRINITY_DN2364_c0_g1_i2.p1  ORF type:complete len:194 (-),score=32.37 TRINITY_DN2364_c0_g1_i2:152-673(-)
MASRSGLSASSALQVHSAPDCRLLPTSFLPVREKIQRQCHNADTQGKLNTGSKFESMSKLSALAFLSNIGDLALSRGSAAAEILSSVASDPSQAADAVLNSAAEESLAAASSTGPEWLPYFLLAFPVLTYGGFNILREKVNPNASLVDFFFLLTAGFIVLNGITIVFFKVRLY